MTIFKTAYDTQICFGAILKPTKEAIRESLINGDITFDSESGFYPIATDAASLANIPAFSHPMIVEIDGEEKLFVDLRAFGKWSKQSDSFVVRTQTEYRFAMARGSANRIWLDQSKTMIRDLSPMMTSVFSSWLSEAITKRFALDPREQLDLAILAAFHFQYLFHDGTPDEHAKVRMMSSIIKNTHTNSKDVERVLDMLPDDFGSIKAFCRMTQEVTESIRLKDFNFGLLVTLLGGSWFAPNSSELIGVALEHPPTWMMILYSAMTERGAKNAGITKIAERSSSMQMKDFVRATVSLMTLVND